MGLSVILSLFVAFMCGRTSCTLARDDIVKACSYQDRKGKRRRSVWKEAPGGQQYKTSYNMAPGAFSPVLLSSKHFKEFAGKSDVDHVVMPMKWGMVPHWHKGDSPSKVAFKTSNCRGESMLEKATFKIPLQQGCRCVVIMDGFYEWKTMPSGKQPYYFQFSQRSFQQKSDDIKGGEKMDVKMESFTKDIENLNEGSTEKMEIKTEASTLYEKMVLPVNSYEEIKSGDGRCSEVIKQECCYAGFRTENRVICSHYADLQQDFKSWTGHRLLTCAAVYDVWQSSHASSPLYSYSIITVAASNDMSWCHHRMPAILSTDQEVCDWLDFSTIPLNKASSLIHPKAECLTSHAVSKNVNNSHYQSLDCIQPVNLKDSPSKDKKKLSGSGQMMMNWLKRGQASPSKAPPTKASKI